MRRCTKPSTLVALLQNSGIALGSIWHSNGGSFLSVALMLEYLADKPGIAKMAEAAQMIDNAVERGFVEQRIRPLEISGDMDTRAVTDEVIKLITEPETSHHK